MLVSWSDSYFVSSLGTVVTSICWHSSDSIHWGSRPPSFRCIADGWFMMSPAALGTSSSLRNGPILKATMLDSPTKSWRNSQESGSIYCASSMARSVPVWWSSSVSRTICPMSLCRARFRSVGSIFSMASVPVNCVCNSSVKERFDYLEFDV